MGKEKVSWGKKYRTTKGKNKSNNERKFLTTKQGKS